MANFALDVKAFADSFEDGAEQAVRGTTIKLFSAIIESSPVGEGRFRGNWFATGQQPSIKVTNKKDKSGESSKKAVEGVVSSLQDWSVFTLTNNLPYASVIEYGGYPDPVKNGTRINATGTREAPITPIYEKRSKAGYSKQAPNGTVRVNSNRFNRLLELEARRNLPK